MINNKSKPEHLHVAFIIPDHYWAGSISLIVDVLAAVNMLTEQYGDGTHPKYVTHYLFDPDVPPKGLSECYFAMQPLAAEHAELLYDIVVVPAIWSITPQQLTQYKTLLPWLTAQGRAGAHLISITSGAIFLAESGLLSNQQITLHWAFQDLFQTLFPNISIRTDVTSLTEGKIWSSSGISPSIDLVYQLVRQYSGEMLARLCAKYFMLDEHKKGPSGAFNHPQQEGRFRDNLVSGIKNWLQANIHRTINSQEIAQQFHMSYRNLNRRFSAEVGHPPQEYLQNLRLDRAAKLMISSKMNVENVAYQCGYSSASALAKAFKKRFGLSPLNYRKFMLSQSSKKD